MLQDPTAGIVAETAGRDVAFGPENLGLGRAEIWRRVHESLELAAFPYGIGRATRTLSGGEAQRLALAGALAVGHDVLLLDEPTSMLDEPTAAGVRGAVRHALDRSGATTVIVEHHLEPWVDVVDRLVVIDRDGHLVADGEPARVLHEHVDALMAAGVWVPGAPAPTCLDVPPELVAPWEPAPPWLMGTHDLHVEHRPSRVYGDDAPARALAGVDVRVETNGITVVTGASGAGKSTLVECLAGLVRPTRGTVEAHPRLGTRRGTQPWRWRGRDLTARVTWVPQLPERGIVARTVADEVRAGAVACGRDGDRARRRGEDLLELFGLGRLAGASPYHLSGGEQRRLMTAAALAHGPVGLCLDEPTVGQDRHTWSAVVGATRAAADSGAAAVVSTHDRRAVDALTPAPIRLDRGVVT